MSLRAVTLFFYISFLCDALADTNSTAKTYWGYFDEKQKNISKEVVKLFDNIDKGISGWMESEDENISCDEKEKKLVDELFKEQISIDEFFKNDKYIEENEASYLRIRLSSLFQSKESTAFDYKIRAQIPLNRTKKSFQLFVDDIEENYFDNATSTKESKDSKAVGVNYFAPTYKDIKSKYSIGISGLSTYAKARYSKDFKFERWLIQPTQQFKYSTKSDWSEETKLYFDRMLEKKSIFRTTLYRKTQSHVDGFDYATLFSYYTALSNKKGFGISQEFWGNSKYVCEASPEPYNGISNYTSSISWRQNIFRKWISYEVVPAVSFHRQYDYKPNYIVGFYVDFYFGNIN